MTKKEFLALLEDMLEANAGSMTGEESLNELEGWDSLAVMGFIAMVDQNFGVTLSPPKIAKSKSVQDLIVLLGDKITV